jgi:HSP20 family protein
MKNAPVDLKQTAPVATNAPDAWRALRTDMDRLFDRFVTGWNMPTFGRQFDAGTGSDTMSPVVDITEGDAAYEMSAELPGMTAKDIEVELSGNLLTLKGEKRTEKEQDDTSLYLSERSYGTFQRSFAVPDGVDRDNVTAEFSNGVLRIILPKTAKALEQQKKIEVKAVA